MDKSPDAFRTISEVSEVLETPAHVLRFWESRFPQIRPVKRAGGRRYYRPADVALLTGIKRLLHDEGMTIRGVQKILREQGVRHVAGLSGEMLPDSAEDAEAALEAALAANFPPEDAAPLPQEQVETAQIVALETALRRTPPARAATPPIQENLFASLFDSPLTPERPAEVVHLTPKPEEEPEIFVEVTEALALIAEEEALLPEADADEADADGAPALPDPFAEPDDLYVPDMIAEIAEPPPEDTALPDPAPMPPPVPDLPLAARIAAVPGAALQPYRARLRVLRDRLLAVEDRMTAPPY